MGMVHSVRDYIAEPKHASGYEPGGAVAALHQDIAARLNPAVREMLTPQPVGMAERCIRGFSRAIGPMALLAGYAAVGAGLYYALT